MDNYFWTPGSGQTIEEYIKKARPSILTDEDTPWIWVSASDEDDSDPGSSTSHASALAEAQRILSDLETRIAEVETDDSIPTRAKKGQKSKKAVREEAHDGAKESLKNLSRVSKWTIGKWLLFPRHDFVDGTWSTIAKSVANGPLKEAGVMLAKVAPTPSSPAAEVVTHLICLYMKDIYDLTLVRNVWSTHPVLTTLILQHGLEPSAAKSDLYTMAGIDSNHPTKLRSSIWRPNELIEGGNEGIKKLKDQYQANKRKSEPEGEEGGKKGNVTFEGIIESDSEDERVGQKRKAAPAGKEDKAEPAKESKVEDGGKESLVAKKTAKSVKHRPSKALKFKDEDIFAGGSDSE